MSIWIRTNFRAKLLI